MESPNSPLSSVSGMSGRSADPSAVLKDLLQLGKPTASNSLSDVSSLSIPLSTGAVEASALELEHTLSESSQKSDLVSEEDMVEMLLSLRNSNSQLINLTGDDQTNSFSVHGDHVQVVASKASNSSNTPGSNKVKINPVVNFDWEAKHYMGQLVAVHRNGLHVAYVLRGQNGSGIVRVIQRRTAERALLKGFTGKVLDVAFAHLSAVVLGAVDHFGNLSVYEILEDPDGKIDAVPLLQVKRDAEVPGFCASDHHRIIWCPFIPDEEEQSSAGTADGSQAQADSAGKMLVLIHDEVAEVLNVDTIAKEYGAGPLLNTDIDTGCLAIKNHTKPIIAATLSPDGSALATASQDGLVKFFQVYLWDQVPKCLHQWQPHEDKPLSCLFFLDDHKQASPDVQFWKFAVTGCNNNRELKVWSCETWKCLQKITFHLPTDIPSNFKVLPCLKAGIDLAANYMVMSDIRRKVVYIIRFHKDMEKGLAHVSSISEFLLAQPCLSFTILDASRRKLHTSTTTTQHDILGDITTGEVEEEEEEEVANNVQGSNVGTVVKMYAVHTRALQELQIRYQAVTSVAPSGSMPSSANDSMSLNDGLSDFSHDTLPSADNVAAAGGGGDNNPFLLTPDAFTKSKPAARSSEQSEGDGGSTVSSSLSSLTQVTGMDEDALRSARGSMLQADTSLPHSQAVQRNSAPAAAAAASPSSSVTLTPASSRDISLQGTPHQVTPSNRPLPPVTPGEESALQGSPGSSAPSTPLASVSVSVSSSAFFTSSPSQPPRHTPPAPGGGPADFMPPSLSSEDDGEMKRVALRSTGSSSETSLEVNEIMQKSKENLRHVEDLASSLELEGESITPIVASTDPAPLSSSKQAAKGYDASIWPKPPLVSEVDDQVKQEAQNMSVQAIQRAADFHRMEVNNSAEVPEEQIEAGEEEEEEDEVMREGRLHTREDMVGVDEEEENKQEEDVVLEEDGEVEDEEEEEEEEEREEAAVAPVAPVNPELSASSVSSSFPFLSPAPSSQFPHLSSAAGLLPRDSFTGSGDHQTFPVQSHPVPAIDITHIDKLQQSMQEMLELVKSQQGEIEELRGEVRSRNTSHESLTSLQARIHGLEGTLTAHVTGALSKHHKSEAERFQQVLGQRELRDQQQMERVVAKMSEKMERTICNRMDKLIKEEMKSQVMPALRNMIEPLKISLHTEMAQKLTATDNIVKDNIAKLIRSRSTVETMGSSAATAMMSTMQGSFRDILIPAFNDACHNMVQQINSNFQRGTAEYVYQLNSHMEEVRQEHLSKREPLIQELQVLVDGFERHASGASEDNARLLTDLLQQHAQQQQASIAAQIDSYLHSKLANMEENIVGECRKMITEEMLPAVQDQQITLKTQLIDAMRSTAATPVPQGNGQITPDPQQRMNQVLALLKEGQLNNAFQLALSASDLSMVMFVCETVNPSQVFNQQPCPLDQPILLSLIQQLSRDLTSHTELRHKYLEEAVMNLDVTAAITKEHGPTVLRQLESCLSKYIQQHPQEKLSRNMRMLLMASRSLFDS